MIESVDVAIAFAGLMFAIGSALLGYLARQIQRLRNELRELQRDNRRCHTHMMNTLDDFKVYLERVQRNLVREGIEIPEPEEELNIRGDD